MLALGLTESYRSPSSLGWLKGAAALAAGAVIAAVAFNLYESRQDSRVQQQSAETQRQPRTIQWAAASPEERRQREAQRAADASRGDDTAGGTSPEQSTSSNRATVPSSPPPAPKSRMVRAVPPAGASGTSGVVGPVQSYPIDSSPAARTTAPAASAARPDSGSPGTGLNRISFEQARIVASEGAVSAVVRIRRLDDLTGRVRIQWRAIPGGAQPSSDYSMDGIGTIDIPSGQDLRVLYIPILNDDVRESNESFDVELFDLSGPGSLEPITRATVTILDND